MFTLCLYNDVLLSHHTARSHLHFKILTKQECIPVPCAPPAFTNLRASVAARCQHPGGVQRLKKYRFPLKRQTETTESITLSQLCWHAVINYFLLPANEVCEGYVFTGVCSGRSKGSKFFHFHAVFSKKICKIIPIWELAPPPPPAVGKIPDLPPVSHSVYMGRGGLCPPPHGDPRHMEHGDPLLPVRSRKAGGMRAIGMHFC